MRKIGYGRYDTMGPSGLVGAADCASREVELQVEGGGPCLIIIIP